MILFASLISLLLFERGNHHVFGYVAAFAPQTYDVYDRPTTPRLDTPPPSITPGLELRQLLDPESHKAKILNSRRTTGPSRPTTGSSILHAPVTINQTQECVLWDPACHGNRSAAILDFFNGTMPRLLEDSCFTTGPQWDMVCTQSPLPAPSLINSWSTIRSWMRSPACQTAQDEAHRLDSNIQAPAHSAYRGCCGGCGVGGPNVDVYYWESPNANTDCLSIVGTHMSPLLDGATTEGGSTYWAVTTHGTDEDNSIFTTAVYTSVNGISFKLPLRNPWDAMTSATDRSPQNGRPVPTTPAAFPGITSPPAVAPSASAQANAIPIRDIRPRAGRNASQGGFLTTEAPFLPSNGSQVSTVVYNGHTFTSPSIYVDFYSLAATDDCGYLGSSNVITSTLLSFAPGELSTYGGPLVDILHAKLFTPTAYNFADLPCPPQSIMYDQWYKPEPGHPFRPILAFPSSKVLNIDPAWASCSANLFTGVDPPRALGPTNAMAAPVNAQDAFAPQTVYVSVPTSTFVTQSQPPLAPKKQKSQIVAPQETTQPFISNTKDTSNTEIIPPAELGNKESNPASGNKQTNPQVSGEIPAEPENQEASDKLPIEPGNKQTNPEPGKKQTNPQISGEIPADPENQEASDKIPIEPGNKEATSQKSNQVPAPAAQSFASVGGYPIVALPLQQASGSLDHSISVSASDTSNLAANSSNIDGSPKSNNAFLGSQALAQGSSQTSDNSTISKAPTVDANSDSNYDSSGAIGTSSSSGDVGGAPVNDDPQDILPSDNEQSSNQKDRNESLPNQSDGLMRQVYQVGSSQITAGGPTLTIAGTVVFAPVSGDCLVVGGQTVHPHHLSDELNDTTPITTNTQPTPVGEQQLVAFDSHTSQVPNGRTDSLPLPAAKVAGKTFTLLPSKAGVAVDGIILSAGSPDVTLSGTPISLDSDYDVYVAGSIYALATSSVLPAKATGKDGVTEAHDGMATTIAGEALEMVGNGISVAGTTLIPGVKATGISGQVVSNAGNGTVVIGDQTAKLGIMSAGTGAKSTASTTTGNNVLPFEGPASRNRGMVCWQWALLFAAMFVGLVRR